MENLGPIRKFTVKNLQHSGYLLLELAQRIETELGFECFSSHIKDTMSEVLARGLLTLKATHPVSDEWWIDRVILQCQKNLQNAEFSLILAELTEIQTTEPSFGFHHGLYQVNYHTWSN